MKTCGVRLGIKEVGGSRLGVASVLDWVGSMTSIK